MYDAVHSELFHRVVSPRSRCSVMQHVGWWQLAGPPVGAALLN